VFILAPLRNPPVALLWGGLSLSAIGDQLYAVALTWIAVGVFGAAAGYLAAAQALAVLLSVLFIGRWADRWDQQRGMIAADLARAAILAGVVALWLARGATGAAPLVAAVVVLAIGQAVFQPALQTVLPALVAEPRLLPAANGLLDATDRSARLLGPGLVVLLAGRLPVVHFLTIDAGSFLASAAALLAIRRLRPASRPATAAQPVWQAIARGVRAMAGHRLLGFVLATTWLTNGAWYAAFYLALPPMIARHGGDGLGVFGLVISAYGCTNLLSTLVCGSRALPARPQFQMFSGTALVGAGTVLLGLADALPEAWRVPGMAAAAALGAIGGPMKDIPLAVLRQTRLRPGDMAAAMRAYMAVSYTGMLAAMLVTPAAVAAFGVVAVTIGCGVVLAGIGGAGLLRFAAWAEAPLPA
jgi:hypothetical protein